MLGTSLYRSGSFAHAAQSPQQEKQTGGFAWRRVLRGSGGQALADHAAEVWDVPAPELSPPLCKEVPTLQQHLHVSFCACIAAAQVQPQHLSANSWGGWVCAKTPSWEREHWWHWCQWSRGSNAGRRRERTLLSKLSDQWLQVQTLTHSFFCWIWLLQKVSDQTGLPPFSRAWPALSF